MKTLLVTSKVTFVPDNYNSVVIGLADCKQIGGLLLIDNKTFSLFLKSVTVLLSGAYGLGKTLLRNQFHDSHDRRLEVYKTQGKPVWTVKSINDPVLLNIIDQFHFDLILNARARCIFGKKILAKPKLGAINVHHGLLPEQRGLMCDLWSLYHNRPTGFSLHKMTEHIDAGELLRTVQVSDGSENNYLHYLAEAARQEKQAISDCLANIEYLGAVKGQNNQQLASIEIHKDPKWADIQSFKRRALVI